jgi:hypothetical protein
MISRLPKESLIGAYLGIAAFAVIVCFALWWFLEITGEVSHWNNRKLIKGAFEERLLPTAAWVEGIESREHRLPTGEEMKAFCMEKFGRDEIEIYRNPPPWQQTWGTYGRDFMLCSSIPEWNLYYC